MTRETCILLIKKAKRLGDQRSLRNLARELADMDTSAEPQDLSKNRPGRDTETRGRTTRRVLGMYGSMTALGLAGQERGDAP